MQTAEEMLRVLASHARSQAAGCTEQSAAWAAHGDNEMASFWLKNSNMHRRKAEALEAGYQAIKRQRVLEERLAVLEEKLRPRDSESAE